MRRCPGWEDVCRGAAPALLHCKALSSWLFPSHPGSVKEEGFVELGVGVRQLLVILFPGN